MLVSAIDPRPLDEACSCPVCSQGFSRAYIRHLYVAGEILAHRLLSLHNLRFVLDLTARARAAIERGTFSTFRGRGARATRPPNGGGSLAILIILALVLGVTYVVMIRPQRQRQAEQQSTIDTAAVGDDIITTGGIYGTITGAEGDDVVVEIAKGVEVHMTRRAIAASRPAR